MKTILRKISVLFLAIVILNFLGCVTHHPSSQDQAQSDQDAKALQDSMQQINTSLQPPPKDIVEGPVPPENKNIIMYYYVQSGDNLSKIAKRIYGTTSAWKKLAEMNNLKDPNHIYAGDFIHYELDQPAKAFADAYENAPRAKIIVKKGDTLGDVSRAVFGKVSEWRVLWKENPQIKNPDKLIVGQELFFRPKALKIKQQASTEMVVPAQQQQQASTTAQIAPSGDQISPSGILVEPVKQ